MWLPISSIVWKRLLLSMIVLINSFRPSSPIFISVKSQTSSIFGMVDLRAFAGFFLNSFLCIFEVCCVVSRCCMGCCIRCSLFGQIENCVWLCFCKLDAEMRWLLFRSCCTNTFVTRHTQVMNQFKFFFRVFCLSLIFRSSFQHTAMLQASSCFVLFVVVVCFGGHPLQFGRSIFLTGSQTSPIQRWHHFSERSWSSVVDRIPPKNRKQKEIRQNVCRLPESNRGCGSHNPVYYHYTKAAIISMDGESI